MASVDRLDAARPEAEDRQNLRKVVTASFIGTTIEWYDFFLYGTAAALVFNELFFPNAEPLTGTLPRSRTYAVGFVARPLGGIVFGHYGDRVGRKSMLVLSLMIMGIATFLIGCCRPTRRSACSAPILLVLLRFAQGFGVGGEWGGAVLMAVEHAPKGKRGFYGRWPQMGVPAGLAALDARVPARPEHDHRGAVHGLGLAHPVPGLDRPGRRRPGHPPEDPRDAGLRGGQGDQAPTSEKPLVDVVKTHRRDLLTAMGMRIAENGIVLHADRVRPGLRRGRAEARRRTRC